MGWSDCDAEAHGGDYIYLGDDGDAASGLLVGEPFVEVPGGAWKDSIRYAFYLYDGSMISILSLNSKGYKLIKANRHRLDRNMLTITRHGAKGDINMRYTMDLTPVQEAERTDADAAFVAFEAAVVAEDDAQAKAEKSKKK